MNKQTSMAYLAAVLLGGGMLTSCSDSSIEVEEPTPGSDVSNVYATISLVVRDNDASGTRDGDEGSDTSDNSGSSDQSTDQTLEGTITDQGTEAEATVNTLTLYAFDESGILRDITQNVESSYSNYSSADHYTYNSSVVFKNLKYNNEEGSTYHLYAIANPNDYNISLGTSGSITIGTTKEADFLKDLIVEPTDKTYFVTSGNNLPMANRSFAASGTDNADIPYATMTVNANNSQANPATAEIELERLVAKYSVAVSIPQTTTTDNVSTTTNSTTKELTYTATGATEATTYATVEIVGCSPFNLNKSSYAIRHRNTYTEGSWGDLSYCNLKDMSTSIASNWDASSNRWKEADYVLDPLFDEKEIPTDVTTNPGLAYWVHSGDRSYKDISTSLTTLGYSFENTTLDNAQYMENSTGLMFKALITPTEILSQTSEEADGSAATRRTGARREEETTTTYPDSVYYFNHKFYATLAALYYDADAKNYLPTISSFPEGPKETEKTVTTGEGENASTSTVKVWSYNDKEYETKDAANKVYAADNMAYLEKRLYQYGVYKYPKGNKDGSYVCYYPYIFKHLTVESNTLDATPLSTDADGTTYTVTTAQTTMTPMKFAVVRNNWYQVTVTDIQTVGRPTDEPDPYSVTPDEESSVWLKVSLKVRDWTLRKDTGVTLK